MAEGKIFVGRKAEIEQFKEVLKNPKRQAVLFSNRRGCEIGVLIGRSRYVNGD